MNHNVEQDLVIRILEEYFKLFILVIDKGISAKIDELADITDNTRLINLIYKQVNEDKKYRDLLKIGGLNDYT